MEGTIKKYLAEAVGTAVLVLVGCGAATIGQAGGAAIGIIGVAFAFGLAVTAMAYAIGPISGCHINPAVTVGFVCAGRMETSEAIGYIVSQIVGAVVGAAILVVVLKLRNAGWDLGTQGLGQNGWGEGYLGQFGLLAALIVEILATFIFVAVILGATNPTINLQVAGLVIGLTLFVLHFPFVNVTGLSVNPARSFGPALFVGGTALAQLWLFIVAPAIGGALAGILHKQKILSP
jgi:aquaporin Z